MSEGEEAEEYEFFYGFPIERWYIINPDSNKRKKSFIFQNGIFTKDLEDIEKKENIIVYKLVDELITLTKIIENMNNPVTILVEDI